VLAEVSANSTKLKNPHFLMLGQIQLLKQLIVSLDQFFAKKNDLLVPVRLHTIVRGILIRGAAKRRLGPGLDHL